MKLKDDESIRVAKNFRRLRESRGLTQEELGKKVDPPVSWGYIAHIENCEVGLGKRGRLKWAAVFNVETSEFLAPIENDLDRELALLKEEIKKRGGAASIVRRLREMQPHIRAEEETDVIEPGKKEKRKPQKSK